MSDSKALKIVAVLFLLSGISACIEFLLSFGQSRIFLPFGVLGFFIYPGLLAYRRGWRTVALVLLWIPLVIIPVMALFAMFSSASTYIDFLGSHVAEVPLSIFLAWTAACWLFNAWQYGVLVRPSIRMKFLGLTTTVARRNPFDATPVLGVALCAFLPPLSYLAFSGSAHLSILPPHFGRQSHGMGYEVGLYQGEDENAYQETRAGFAAWIVTRGFTQCPSPDGMAAWGGSHSSGDTQQWYQMPVGDNRLMLRITQYPREITADLNDDGYYTRAELADMRSREAAIWNEMITWFETNSRANTYLENPNMKHWYADDRVSINKAYARPN